MNSHRSSTSTLLLQFYINQIYYYFLRTQAVLSFFAQHLVQPEPWVIQQWKPHAADVPFQRHLEACLHLWLF